MTQPTGEAYIAAWVAYEALAIAGRYDIQPIVDAVWPFAVDVGRRQRDAELAPLVEAAKALVAAIGATLPPDMGLSDPALGLILGKEERALLAAVDALTREDTGNE